MGHLGSQGKSGTAILPTLSTFTTHAVYGRYTFDENAESEVFLGVGVTEVDFFFDFCDLYGKMVVESTHKYAPTG